MDGIYVVVLLDQSGDTNLDQSVRVQVFADNEVVDDRTIQSDSNKSVNYTVDANK